MPIKKINNLIKYSKRPKLYAKGEKKFWNDPHIAKSMLKAHLSQENDLASYKLSKVQRIVEFCSSELNLKAGSSILDCGCGPGLYCERFYERGFSVTGIDISFNSIEYAKKSAADKGLKISYYCQNYLDIGFVNEFAAALIIWQDFCVLDYKERKRFLKNIYKALEPDGYFVFDVSTAKFEEKNTEHSAWSAHESGFWSPNPHIVLENLYFYDNKHLRLNQYIIIEENRERVFWIYHQHYTISLIKKLLSEHGFEIVAQYEDLMGEKLKDKSMSIGIIAKRIK